MGLDIMGLDIMGLDILGTTLVPRPCPAFCRLQSIFHLHTQGEPGNEAIVLYIRPDII